MRYVLRGVYLLVEFLFVATLSHGAAIAADQCLPPGYTDVDSINPSFTYAKRIADCYLEHNNYKAAEEWYARATDVTNVPTDLTDPTVELPKLHPDSKDVMLGQAYYRYALVLLRLGDRADAEVNADFAFDYNPNAAAGFLLKRLSKSDYQESIASLARQKASIEAAKKDRETQRDADANATPDEREQFEYWDRLTPDEQSIVSANGGTRRDNKGARPCHIAYDYSAGVGSIEIWYYYCITPDGIGRASYTFVNGKLQDSASY